MKDLMEMSYEIAKSEKSPRKQQELFTEQFLEELLQMKSADLAPHLSCKFDVIKREYNVMLSFPAVLNEMESKQSQALKVENEQLKKENDTLIKIIDMTFSLTELWAKKEGLIQSDLNAKEDIDKEFAEGKEQIRALFNDLIETGEPAFVNGFFRALNLPEDLQHLI